MKEKDIIFGTVKIPEGIKVVINSNPEQLATLIKVLMHDKEEIAKIFLNAALGYVAETATEEGVQILTDALLEVVKARDKERESKKSKTQEEIAREFLEKSPQVKAIIAQLEKQANGIKS